MSDEEEKELNEIDAHISAVKKEELQAQKKKKKIAEKERKKLQEKMNLKMVLNKYENPGMQDEDAIFRLSMIRSGKELDKVLDQKPEILPESDHSDDEQIKPKKIKYSKENSYLDKSGLLVLEAMFF